MECSSWPSRAQYVLTPEALAKANFPSLAIHAVRKIGRDGGAEQGQKRHSE